LSKYIFSLYHLITLFIIPTLVVITGFKYNTETSANLSLIYSIVFMVFFPLNGNVRHYILNSNNNYINNLITFRLLSYFPLFLLSFLIAYFVLDTDYKTILKIVLLGSFYWINEIFVSFEEKNNKYQLIFLLIILYSFSLFMTLFVDNIKGDFTYVLIAYLISLIFALDSIFKKLKFKIVIKNVISDIKEMIIPQIGGTFMIGISSFLYKVLILSFISKSVAGTIFIALTISGLMLTVFTYGLGPSIIKNQISKDQKTTVNLIYKLSVIPILIGIMSVLLKYFNIINFEIIENQEIFFYCFGISLMGIPFSILGQYFKLSVIYQSLKLNVYIYDSIPNLSVLLLILLIILNFETYLVGITYLYTGALTFFIYKRLYSQSNRVVRQNI